MKVITIVGTRPELIRLSRIIPLLDETVNHILVHTDQNYDYELNEIFFKELEIRKPNYSLKIKNTSVGYAIGETLIKTEEILKKEKPNAVLILGDTNSSLSAIIAKRLRIPIYHMEAGNRSFDINVPEEINRKIVDHISDFNLVYTERARQHLLSEGFPHRRIYLTGSPLREVLDFYKTKIENSKILTLLNLKTKKYFIVSAHREENVDNPLVLRKIIEILNNLAKDFKIPIIVSTHPRTKKQLEKNKDINTHSNIKFLKPFGFFDYIKLQKNAFCVLSDSGTISEESAMLNFPAITIRNSMERPEALDAGTIILTGFDYEVIIKSIERVTYKKKKSSIPIEYTINNTSERVVNIILGTAGLSNKWAGINSNT